MSYSDRDDFFTLKGKTITKIEFGNESVDITTLTDKIQNQYSLYHEQDCCESVSLYRVIGNIADVLNAPITLAEEDAHSNDPDWYTEKSDWRDSFTWSVFVLETTRGRVEFWFLGESNGYYGETVNFHKVN